MRICLLLFCGLIAVGNIQGQIAWKPILSPYLKAGTYSSLHADVFSTTGNQAALAKHSSFSMGVFGERKFMLEELNTFSGAVALPTSSGVFGLQVHQIGNAGFAQRQAGLAYAKALGKKVDVGAQFNYYNIHISGYGDASSLNVEAGAIFHFTEQLHGGLHVSNPTFSRIGKMGEEKIPSVYSFGFAFDASEQFFVGAEIEKAESKSLDVNASMQYVFTKQLLARVGVSSGSSLVFFGIGFKIQDMRIDATASLHPQLGLSPGLMLIYNKSDKQ